MKYQITEYLRIAVYVITFSFLIFIYAQLFKLKRKTVYLLFSILFLALSMVFISISVEPLQSSDETHEFDIGVYPDQDIFINDFTLFYDFEKQEGEIQFCARGEGMNKLDQLRVYFPENSIITDITLFNDSDEIEDFIFDCVDKRESKIYENDTICIRHMDSYPYPFKLDFLRQKSRFRIHLKFKSSLKPDSKFIFDSDNKLRGSRRDGTLFDFYLGDYECKDNCLLSSWDRIILSKIYKPTNPKIIINRESEGIERGYKKVGREEFTLNVQNNKSKFLSNLYIAISTGFFIVAFTLLVQFIIALLYKKEE